MKYESVLEFDEDVRYELSKDLSGLPEGIYRLGNMLEFYGEYMAVFTIHHTIRWKQWTIFSINMYASMLQTFYAWPDASFSNTSPWCSSYCHTPMMQYVPHTKKRVLPSSKSSPLVAIASFTWYFHARLAFFSVPLISSFIFNLNYSDARFENLMKQRSPRCSELSQCS